jgi:hypothetical protein
MGAEGIAHRHWVLIMSRWIRAFDEAYEEGYGNMGIATVQRLSGSSLPEPLLYGTRWPRLRSFSS